MNTISQQPRHMGAKSMRPREVWRDYAPRHRMAWADWPTRSTRAESDAYWDNAIARRKEQEDAR